MALNEGRIKLMPRKEVTLVPLGPDKHSGSCQYHLSVQSGVMRTWLIEVVSSAQNSSAKVSLFDNSP